MTMLRQLPFVIGVTPLACWRYDGLLDTLVYTPVRGCNFKNCVASAGPRANLKAFPRIGLSNSVSTAYPAYCKQAM
jgi:hypothetical protein